MCALKGYTSFEHKLKNLVKRICLLSMGNQPGCGSPRFVLVVVVIVVDVLF